jgi:deoxycytidylate deaminase
MDLENILFNTIQKSNMNSKYACAIVYRNKIISIGINRYKIFEITSDYETNKYSIHAEKDAIMKVKDKNILKYCKIYIVKIKNGQLEQGIPCPMCYNLLKKYNINKIY